MLNQQKLNPASQLALLLAFCGIGMVIFSVFIGLVAKYILHIPLDRIEDAMLSPANLQVSRLLQVFSSFLMWGVPALAIAGLSGKNAAGQLGLAETFSIQQLLLITIMVAAGFFISSSLVEVTHLVPITESAGAYFKKLEDNYTSQVMVLANMKTTNDYIFSLMIIAIVPAFFEELFFRGALQQTLISLTRNAFIGIVLTSILFSLIHLSFYGFLSRFMLALVLGYIFYFSKNLWISMAAHFLNNAYSITALYSLSRQGKLTAESMEDSFPVYYGIIAMAVMLLLFVLFKKESDRLLLNNADKLLTE